MLDLATNGRVLPLAEVIDRKRDANAWEQRVRSAVSRVLANDATSAEIVANVTIKSEQYLISSTGIALCAGYLSQAFDALGGCEYTLSWSELAPFWISGSALERVKSG